MATRGKFCPLICFCVQQNFYSCSGLSTIKKEDFIPFLLSFWYPTTHRTEKCLKFPKTNRLEKYFRMQIWLLPPFEYWMVVMDQLMSKNRRGCNISTTCLKKRYHFWARVFIGQSFVVYSTSIASCTAPLPWQEKNNILIFSSLLFTGSCFYGCAHMCHKIHNPIHMKRAFKRYNEPSRTL